MLPNQTPDVILAADLFREQLLERDANAIAALTRRWLVIESSLNAEIQSLVDELVEARERGESISESQLLRLNQFRALLASVQSEMSGYNDDVAEPTISSLTNESAEQGLGDALTMMRVASASAIDRSRFRPLPTGAIQQIVSSALAGNPLDRLLQNAYPLAANGIANQLIIGVARGRNPRQVARDVVRQGLAQGLNHILLVSRDQSNRSYRQAMQAQYQNNNLIYGYRRLAAKNERTCMACLALDGRVFRTADFMPLHPQDRCTMVPLIKGIEPIQYQTGREWFAEQPAEVQQEMMGKGAFELWQDGQVEIDQFATSKPNRTWGPSAAVTTLKDLKRGRGGVDGEITAEEAEAAHDDEIA